MASRKQERLNANAQARGFRNYHEYRQFLKGANWNPDRRRYETPPEAISYSRTAVDIALGRKGTPLNELSLARWLDREASNRGVSRAKFVRDNPDLIRQRADMMRSMMGIRSERQRGERILSPRGELANYLVAIGYRDPDDDTPVGETEKED